MSEHAQQSIDGKKFKAPAQFGHALLVLGGAAGIEEHVENDPQLSMSGGDAARLFTSFVRTCPAEGSRTIRTEECLSISLAKLAPAIEKALTVAGAAAAPASASLAKSTGPSASRTEG